MRSKDEIVDAMNKIRDRIDDKTIPMELEDWAYSEGQYKILAWVIDYKTENDLLKGANDETIKKAQAKLAKEVGFGIPPEFCEDDH